MRLCPIAARRPNLSKGCNNFGMSGQQRAYRLDSKRWRLTFIYSSKAIPCRQAGWGLPHLLDLLRSRRFTSARLIQIRRAIPCTPLSRKQASVGAQCIQDHPPPCQKISQPACQSCFFSCRSETSSISPQSIKH